MAKIGKSLRQMTKVYQSSVSAVPLLLITMTNKSPLETRSVARWEKKKYHFVWLQSGAEAWRSNGLASNTKKSIKHGGGRATPPGCLAASYRMKRKKKAL